jgi:arsenical pump membrane protein
MLTAICPAPLIDLIVALATAGVIIRPFNLPEWVWPAAGVFILVTLRLLPLTNALQGVGRGGDVYLFLTGMMLLAELARLEGLFDWLAAHAVHAAHGSPGRLFTLIYAVGTIVTVFLSNDATAVVLTPAVVAIARTANAEDPLPYLLVCALVANAASFVLPISNPANLVIYGSHIPPLLQWLPRYAAPSIASILITYAILRWTQRHELRGTVSTEIDRRPLTTPGKCAAVGIGLTAIALLTASGLGLPLGWPTLTAAATATLVVLIKSKNSPMTIVKNISWGVLPLVAGLFVLVEAIDSTGLTTTVASALKRLSEQSLPLAVVLNAGLLGFGSNAVNNLPAGLLAGRILEVANSPDQVRAAALIGVDLGPNFSVTGSLATILWLAALKRDGIKVTAWQFLKIGALVMPPALIVAVAGTFLLGGAG